MGDDLKCARCGFHTCRHPGDEPEYPDFCPIPDEAWAEPLAEAREAATTGETRTIAAEAARTEAAGYGRQTRVEEIMAFARRIGVEHIGVAFCVGLYREARLFVDILEHHGFQVSSACCKVGAIPKEDIGLADHEKIRPGQHENTCNPGGQARLLDAAGCGLHVLVGLCVGHDSIFFQAAKAPVTVLVAKDRVLGHNPVAALYTSRSYYRRLRGE